MVVGPSLGCDRHSVGFSKTGTNRENKMSGEKVFKKLKVRPSELVVRTGVRQPENATPWIQQRKISSYKTDRKETSVQFQIVT